MKTTIEIELFEGREGQTFDEAIFQEASCALANSVSKTVRDRLVELVEEIARKEIAIAVGPIIVEALNSGVVKTNQWGEPMGKAQTLREAIAAEAEAYLRGPMDRYHSDRGSRLQVLIRELVEATFQRECKAAIEAGKAEVLAAVREKAASVLAETITAMARR